MDAIHGRCSVGQGLCHTRTVLFHKAGVAKTAKPSRSFCVRSEFEVSHGLVTELRPASSP